MRLSLRFLVPLLLALGVFAWAAVPLTDALMLRWFVRDLDIRANLIANTVHEPLGELVASGSTINVTRYLSRIAQDERIYAAALCRPGLPLPVATKDFPGDLRCDGLAEYSAADGKHVLDIPTGPLHVAAQALEMPDGTSATLVLVHDMRFVQRRSDETRRYLFYFFVALAASVALITTVIAQLSWRGWVHGLRALLRGEGLLRPASMMSVPELRPIARDVKALIRELEARYRPRDEEQLAWNAQTLRSVLEGELKGHEVIVVSNREPYIHVRDAGLGPGAAAGERPRHRARAGDAGVLGHVDRARQRLGRPRRRRRARPHRRAARRPGLPAAPDLAHAGRGGRLLQRLRQRGPVAAVPHRARAAHVPLLGLRRLPQGQRALRRRGGRRGALEGPDRPRAGLPLRAAAADDPRAAAARDDHHVLAHPVAQPRGVRDLPVARRAARRTAGQQHPRLPHPVPLQQLPRHRRPAARGARGPRVVHRALPRPLHGRQPLPDLDRVAARRRSRRRRTSRRRGATCGRGSSFRPTTRSASASSGSTTRRASSSASGPSAGCSRWSRSGWAGSRSCRSPRRRAA